MEQLPPCMYRTGFDDLPDELQWKVVKRIAMLSVNDLLNFKMTNWHSYHLTEDRRLYHRVNTSEQWLFLQEGVEYEEHEQRFIDICVNAENPELIWRRGVRQFFSSDEQELGLANIRLAASGESFHFESRYLLAMILIRHGGADAEEAISILKSLERRVTRRRMYDALLDRIGDCLHEMGMVNKLRWTDLVVECNNVKHTLQYIIDARCGYVRDLDHCPKCQWYQDYIKFCIVQGGWL